MVQTATRQVETPNFNYGAYPFTLDSVFENLGYDVSQLSKEPTVWTKYLAWREMGDNLDKLRRRSFNVYESFPKDMGERKIATFTVRDFPVEGDYSLLRHILDLELLVASPKIPTPFKIEFDLHENGYSIADLRRVIKHGETAEVLETVLPDSVLYLYS